MTTVKTKLVDGPAARGLPGPAGLYPFADWQDRAHPKDAIVAHRNAVWLARQATTQEPAFASDGGVASGDWSLWIDGRGAEQASVDAQAARDALDDALDAKDGAQAALTESRAIERRIRAQDLGDFADDAAAIASAAAQTPPIAIVTGSGYWNTTREIKRIWNGAASPPAFVDEDADAQTQRANASTSAVAAENARGLAQEWATKTDGEVAPGAGYGAKRYSQDAADARDLARKWATQTSDEVVAGQGYGAKKYAQDAAGAATAAAVAAASGAPDYGLRQQGMASGDLLADVSLTQALVNRQDSVAIAAILTHEAGGLRVAQTTNRHADFDLGRRIGGAVGRFSLFAAGATATVGFTLTDNGANWLNIVYAPNGRVSFLAGGAAVAQAAITTMPTWVAGATLKFVGLIGPSGDLSVAVSAGGQTGAFLVPAANLPAACRWLRGANDAAATATWSMAQEATPPLALALTAQRALSSDQTGQIARRLHSSAAYLVATPAPLTIAQMPGAAVFYDPIADLFECSLTPEPFFQTGGVGFLELWWDPVAGSDTNSGTSRDAPLKTAGLAVALAYNGDLLLHCPKDAVSTYLTGFAGVQSLCRSLQVVCDDGGVALMTTRVTGLVWSDQGGGVYTAPMPAGVAVAEVADDKTALRTVAGDDTVLTKIGTNAVAAAQWFYDTGSGVLTVKRADSSAPDATLFVYAKWGSLRNLDLVTPGSRNYFKGIVFDGSGGGASGALGAHAGPSANRMLVMADACGFGYSTTNGLSVQGAVDLILKDTWAAQNRDDHFNLHWYTGAYPAPRMIEISCPGRAGGFAKDGSSNLDTAHDGSLLWALNGAGESDSTPLAFVSGAQAWICGRTVSRASLGDAIAYGQPAMVMAGAASDAAATIVVLDGVKIVGDGSIYDLYSAGPGSTIYYNPDNCIFQNGANVPTLAPGTTAVALARVGGPPALHVKNGGTGVRRIEAGDLLVGAGRNLMARLAKDADGKFLSLVAGAPTWVPAPGAGGGGAIVRGHLAGFVVSNDGSSPNTKVNIAAGQCATLANDAYVSCGAGSVDFSTAGLGGLDTGVFQASKTYFLHAIQKADGSASGYIGSLSYAAPTMPAGYTLFRPIWAVMSNASTQLRQFSMSAAGRCVWTSQATSDVSGTTAAGANLVTLTIPQAIQVRPIIRTQISAHAIIWSGPGDPDVTPTGSAAGTIWDASGSWNMTVRYADLLSDTSGRLRYRAEGAGYTFRVDTIGFEWNRGRFD